MSVCVCQEVQNKSNILIQKSQKSEESQLILLLVLTQATKPSSLPHTAINLSQIPPCTFKGQLLTPKRNREEKGFGGNASRGEGKTKLLCEF